jgi:BMFP domain-containing protein YqiC
MSHFSKKHMTEKEKYTSRALLNKEKTWREFDRLSLKSKRKDKKDIKVERIETNIEKFKASRIVKSLESSFSQRKLESLTFSFIFESKSKTNKRIETNRVETSDSLFIDTSSSWKEEQIEKSFEDSSITKEKTSASHINTSIESISTISKISASQIVAKKRKMSEDSNIKTFWDKRNEKKNLEKYLKNIEFTYQTNYKAQEAHEKNKIKYKKNVHRILFRQNLREEVEKWYFDLKKTMKSDWKTLQTVFKTQFEMKADAKANKYLLLQRVATLNQRQNENIIEYFRWAKSLAKHLLSATKTIDYNVVKSMKNKSQRERVNFECNKDKNFSLKKIKQIIQAAYQTVDTVSSFDSEWRQIENLFNLFKEKDKALFSEKWNQQILSNISSRHKKHSNAEWS